MGHLQKNRAVVLRGPGKVDVTDVPYPQMVNPYNGSRFQHGAIVKVVASNICGTDLHMYRGRMPFPQDCRPGHEVTGEVVEVGSDVEQVKVGDLVVVAAMAACGRCDNCKDARTHMCLSTNPEMPGSGACFGFPPMGKWNGGQAQFMAIPYADINLVRLGDKRAAMSKIFDIAMLNDVLPTAYQAAVCAGPLVGKSVYIAGAGPVGICCAASCFLLGASYVVIGDVRADRLEQPRRMGCTVVDLAGIKLADLPAQIKRATGSELVDVAIDCVGFECHGFGDMARSEQPTAALDSMAEVLKPGGIISLPGVYTASVVGARDSLEKEGRTPLQLGKIWQKGATIAMGAVPMLAHTRVLLRAILSGRLSVAQYLNIKVISIEDAPTAYRNFCEGAPVKYVIDPNGVLAQAGMSG